jgi:hypothetical protein
LPRRHGDTEKSKKEEKIDKEFATEARRHGEGEKEVEREFAVDQDLPRRHGDTEKMRRERRSTRIICHGGTEIQSIIIRDRKIS